jgi:hypothetical protein
VGRPGKQEEGSAKTREVKLGAIFTQTKTDEEGRPVRDHASTSHGGSFESAPDLGSRIRAEGLRRGSARAAKVVFIGEGAAWIWELARVNFPAALFILNLYHALERLHAFCAGLSGEQTPWALRMARTGTAMLKNDQIGPGLAAASRIWGRQRRTRWKSKSPVLSAIKTRCATRLIGSGVCSMAQGSSKADANPSSASACKNRACFGRKPEPPAF